MVFPWRWTLLLAGLLSFTNPLVRAAEDDRPATVAGVRGLNESSAPVDPDARDADQGGLLLAAQTGYDPQGLPRVIELLKSLAPSDALLAHLTKTHPAPADRLKTLEKTAKKNRLPETGQRLLERFKRRA